MWEWCHERRPGTRIQSCAVSDMFKASKTRTIWCISRHCYWSSLIKLCRGGGAKRTLRHDKGVKGLWGVCWQRAPGDASKDWPLFLLQEEGPLPGPKCGSCLTLGHELSEDTHADKARDSPESFLTSQFKASILQHSAFFMIQLSHMYMTTRKTVALTIQTFVDKVMSLLFIMLSRFVIAFLPRSKSLLIHGYSHHLQWFVIQH